MLARKYFFCDLVVEVGRDPVLSVGAKGEDVPSENVSADAAVGGLLHDPAPEFNLLVDGDALYHFVVGKHGRPNHVRAPKVKGIIELHARAPDVVQRDLGKLRHLHQRGEGMQAPKREHVVAIARQRIEIVGPKCALPHFRDVGLRGVGGVAVARGAQIEREVELDAALRDVRLVVGVLQRVERTRANRLCDVQPAVHGARGIGGAHGDGAESAFLLHADAVALGRSAVRLFHGERDARGLGLSARGQALRGGLAADFLGGKFSRPAGRRVVGQAEARGQGGRGP